MKVLLVNPGERAQLVEIGDKLEDKQKAVGGSIEAVYPYEDDVALICNDEGKINGMELNRALYSEDGEIYDIIAGPFLVVGLSEGNFDSLPDDLILKYKELFDLSEHFASFNGSIFAVTYNP